MNVPLPAALRLVLCRIGEGRPCSALRLIFVLWIWGSRRRPHGRETRSDSLIRSLQGRLCRVASVERSGGSRRVLSRECISLIGTYLRPVCVLAS
jgi:hypothetical protein